MILTLKKEIVMPKISIIIPVYNVEKYICACIESIRQQAFQDWELILVNDASSDKSLQIIKEYEVKDERIKVLSYDENKGPMYAREKGCEIARGEYVTFCDSDDQFAADALQLMYTTAKERNVDVVVGQFMNIYPDGRREPYFIQSRLNYGNDRVSFYKSVLLREMHQGLAGKMFRGDIVRNSNITVFEHCLMSEDAAVLFQYIEKCNTIYVLKDFTYYYVQHQSSSTHSLMKMSTLEGILKTTRLRINVLTRYPNLEKIMNNYFIGNLIGFFPQYNSHGEYYILIKRYNLERFVNRINILRYCDFKHTLYYLFLRDIYPMWNRVEEYLK